MKNIHVNIKSIILLVLFISMNVLMADAPKTREEFLQMVEESFIYGDTGIPEDYEDLFQPIQDRAAFHERLPLSFDWRDKGKVTGAKNQGGCGSCWAFAATGALESKILIAEDKEYDIAEQHQISCNYAMHKCHGGGMYSLKFWETKAPIKEDCPEAKYTPYDVQHIEGIPCNALNGCEKLPYSVKGFYTVDTVYINEIKKSIYDDGPTYFRFDVYEDFKPFWYDAEYDEVYIQKSGQKKGGHAVLIIGWDDGKKAWLCKNSWYAPKFNVRGPNGDGTFWMFYDGHKNNLNFGMANIKLAKESNDESDEL